MIHNATHNKKSNKFSKRKHFKFTFLLVGTTRYLSRCEVKGVIDVGINQGGGGLSGEG